MIRRLTLFVGGRENFCDVRVGFALYAVFPGGRDRLCATEKESLEAGAMILQPGNVDIVRRSSGPNMRGVPLRRRRARIFQR